MDKHLTSSTLYTRRLSAIFPCTPRKTPAVRSWKNCHSSGQRIASSPYTGISPPPGLLVIDLDTYKGVTTAEVDNALGAELPWDTAFLQSTTSGGRHYVFQADQVCIESIRNSHDTLGVSGFDVRCPDRGYIVTGEGYTVNSLFPSVRLALEQGRWPELPKQAVDALSASAGEGTRAGAGDADITMCKGQSFLEDNTAPYGVPNRCVPTAHGQRNACLLMLARWFLGKNPDATDAQLREVLTNWYIASIGQMKTDDFDVSLREFTAAYRTAHTPMIPSLDAMLDGFQNDPIQPDIAAKLNATEQDIYRITERLNNVRGGQSFHLSARIAGKYIGRSHTTAANALKRLRELGLLVITKVAKFIKDGVSFATEYMLSNIGEKSCNVRAAATSLIHRVIGKTAHVLSRVIAPLVDVQNDDCNEIVSIQAGALPLMSRQN